MTGKSLPRVPEGLRDLMKMYAKEVLREKPEDLYKFSADFFNSIVTEKSNRGMRKYEPIQTYENIIKKRMRQQVPLSLVFHIVPEHLTELIKQFIKEVLKESPDNIYIFAQEYFQKLSETKSIHTEYTKYTAYEESVRDKEPFPSVTNTTCQCGRIITAETAEVRNNFSISNDVIPFKDDKSIAEGVPENKKKYGPNYLKAVIIIQRNFRRYKKQTKIVAEKENRDREYIRAVFMIQRVFRRYLAKKRFNKRKESRQNDIQNTRKYINAVIVIQRQYRQYLKKIGPKNRLKSGSFGLVTAAITIQRAFRRMVDARKFKGNGPAVAENRDELNDIDSETCSYNSKSTAILSTESTCENNDFGNTNYEELIQSTIQMDEEVDNNNTYQILENEYPAIQEYENPTKIQKNAGKSTKDCGNTTGISVFPDKDEQTTVIGSDISKSGKKLAREQDIEIFGTFAAPKELEDGLSTNETQIVSEDSNIKKRTIADISEQPAGIGLNLEDDNEATGKSTEDNGDKTEIAVLPDKGEKPTVIEYDISESGKSLPRKEDFETSDTSATSHDLNVDFSTNGTQSISKVSNLTKRSIADISEQPAGKGINLEDDNEATGKSTEDNGDKTEIAVLPDKGEKPTVIEYDISESGKSLPRKEDFETSDTSATSNDLNVDFSTNGTQSISKVSNLTKRSIADISEQPAGLEANLEDDNKATGKLTKFNGDKTELAVFPDKDEKTTVIESDISESVKSLPREEDVETSGTSDAPKELEDDLSTNGTQSISEVSNLTKRSVAEIPEQPAGRGINLEDDNEANEKSTKVNGDKTDLAVLPDNDEKTIAIVSDISESGKSLPRKEDVGTFSTSASPKELDDDLSTNEIQSVSEVSNVTKRSIGDISEQPAGIEQNLEDDNEATGKSTEDNGDKTELAVFPDKDEETIAIVSDISESGKSLPREEDVESFGTASPKELDDDLSTNEIQSVSKVSNVTKRSIADISEQPAGIEPNLEDDNEATGKSTEDNGDKTELAVFPDKDEETIAIVSDISESGKSLPREEDVESFGTASPKELDDDLSTTEIQSVSEVSNLTTERRIAEISEQPAGKGIILEDDNEITEKSTKVNGDKTDLAVLPDKDEKTTVIESDISESGNILPLEPDVETSGTSASPIELKDDLSTNGTQSDSEVSNLTTRSIADISEQPAGIEANLEDDNKATGKLTKFNGDKTELAVFPDKDEKTTVIESDISESVKSLPREEDVETSGTSDAPKELEDDLSTNGTQSISEVSNLTKRSVAETSEQPAGKGINLEDYNEITGKSTKVNGDKTDLAVLPDKGEKTTVIESDISESVKIVTRELDVETSGSSAAPKELEDDLSTNEIQSVSEVSNLTKRIIAEISEQPAGKGINLEDDNEATGKSTEDNGDKTELADFPNKDQKTTLIESDISESGKSLAREQDIETSGISASPKELEDDLSTNETIRVSEVLNSTKRSIADISEQPAGIGLRFLDDDNEATGKLIEDNGDKTELAALPDKDEETIAIVSDISESGKSLPRKEDAETSGTSATSNKLDDDLSTNETQSVSEVSNLTKINVADISISGLEPNLEDDNEITEKSTKVNGDKTDLAVLPDKDEKTTVVESDISESGNILPLEPDVETSGTSASPIELKDDLSTNGTQSISEVSNLTKRSIADISEQLAGIGPNVEDDNKANGKSTKDHGDKTEFAVSYDKDVQNFGTVSNNFESVKILPLEKGFKTPGSPAPPEDFHGAVIEDTISLSAQCIPDVNNGLIFNESNDVLGSVEDPGKLLSNADTLNHEVVSSHEQAKSSPTREMTITESELFANKQEEVIEEACIKRRSSVNTNECETKHQISSEENQEISGIKDEVTPKSFTAEEVVEPSSSHLVLSSCDEPVIRTMGSLQEQVSIDLEESDIIVCNQLQLNESRESSGQSDYVVFGNAKSKKFQTKDSNSEEESARAPLIRHYTIAGDDARSIFRSVTREDTINDIEIGTKDFMTASSINSTNSLFLDDEISENIRKKIMAFSLSETDSDCIDPGNINQENFDIETAMADTLGTSTETESTIVSAATKIQAGARGFLTRRRMRRASAGTKSSTQETKASFGNAAISESFERLIEDEAAKKIQAAYRIHTRKHKGHNRKIEGISLESNLAARRQKLQRGDALRTDSTPDDDNIPLTNNGHTQKHPNTQRKKGKGDGVTLKTGTELKWLTLRQNSMPVQIDSNILRVIPKHKKKRIKSAEYKKMTSK